MTIIIPIEIITLEDKSYHLMVEAVFPNKIQGSLIIDTGASKTVFDQAFVEPFICDIDEVDNENSSGINAMITQAKVGVIPFIKLESFKVDQLQSLLLDLSHINAIYKKYTHKKIAGLIGSDFLVEYNAIINYANKTLSLSLTQ